MPQRKNLGAEEKKIWPMKKIYILHGWAYFTNKWTKLKKLLEERGYEVKLLKVPGLTSPIDKPWTIDDYILWLNKEIVKEKDVVLVGHSNGGRISLAFSLRFPQKVSHLVLIDSAGIYHDNVSIKLKRSFFNFLAKIGKKIYYSERFKNLLYKVARTSDYKNASPVMKQTMVNLINADKTLQIKDIEIPTTIIWGSDDKTTPIQDAHRMHEKIVNSKLHIIQDARHSPHFTHPEETAELIVRGL